MASNEKLSGERQKVCQLQHDAFPLKEMALGKILVLLMFWLWLDLFNDLSE